MGEKINTITPAHIDEMIRSGQLEARKMGQKTLVATLTLTNGFEVVGTGSCVDPANFDVVLGTKMALEQIKDKLWELEGYRLQWQLEGTLEK